MVCASVVDAKTALVSSGLSLTLFPIMWSVPTNCLVFIEKGL